MVWLKGLASITNFDLSMYLDELNPGELWLWGSGFVGLCRVQCGMQAVTGCGLR
jgi:hypothetical protein